MKKILIATIVLSAAAAGVYFFSPRPGQSPAAAPKIEREEYQKIAVDVRGKINDISPTPPTESSWIVESVEFASGTDMAYITYHDTHNIFRLLAGIENRQGQYRYRIYATFEKSESHPDGWRKVNGEDLAASKALIKVE